MWAQREKKEKLVRAEKILVKLVLLIIYYYVKYTHSEMTVGEYALKKSACIVDLL